MLDVTIINISELSDREKDIYLMGYKRGMEELEGLRNMIIDVTSNYVYHENKNK